MVRRAARTASSAGRSGAAMSDTPIYDQTCEEHDFEPLDIDVEHIKFWTGDKVRSVETIRR